MNIISQFVLGAAIGSLLGAKKLGNKSIVYGGLCALIPSLDCLFSYCFETTVALYVWGGITHSIMFCVLMAPLIGWVMHRLFAKHECSVILCSVIALCGMLAHCLADVLSIGGVGLLEPFSHKRFALSVLAFTDWLSMIPLVLAFVIALIVGDNRHKAMISWFGIFLFFVYVAFSFLNKLSVQSQFEQKLEAQGLRYSRTEVFPVTGSLFMWNCIAQDRDGFWMCNQSNLSKNDFEMNLVLRNDYYLFEIEENLSVRRLEAYTKYFYVVEPMADDIVMVHDLRYGKTGLRMDDRFRNSYVIDYTDKNAIEIVRKQ